MHLLNNLVWFIHIKLFVGKYRFVIDAEAIKALYAIGIIDWTITRTNVVGTFEELWGTKIENLEKCIVVEWKLEAHQILDPPHSYTIYLLHPYNACERKWITENKISSFQSKKAEHEKHPRPLFQNIKFYVSSQSTVSKAQTCEINCDDGREMFKSTKLSFCIISLHMHILKLI